MTATLDRASSSPSAHSSREAWGKILMPTPTALSSGAASKMRQAMPARCSISPSVRPPMPAPMIRTSMRVFLLGRWRLRERGAGAPKGDKRERERDQHIVACKGKAEKAPRRLVAADQTDAVQVLQQVLGRSEIADGPAAFGRPWPPFPFDAGVIG